MVSRVRFGLIGCGNQGRYLGRTLTKVDGAEVVAVADVDKSALEKAVEETGSKESYIDYHELLNKNYIDAVIVAVPHNLLKNVSVEAAEKGKHVFVEKPMGINRHEGREVVDTCKKAGVKLTVGYCLRFNSTVRRMKELIDGDAVGKIDLVTAIRENSTSNWSRWLLNPDMGGGILLYLGSHLIDETLWMVGSGVKRVYGEVNISPELKVDETDVFSIRFKNGVLANLGLSMLSTRRIHRVSIVGTEGTITSDPFEGSLEMYSKRLGGYSYPTSLKITDDPNRSMYMLELEDFVKSITEDREPYITGKDGLKVLEVIDAVFESSKTGRPVNLPMD
ncbi:MAG: Gfo/Idh/MocA family oxidoreductase [Candidatus Bathyarchaeia archaeon]